MFNEHCTRISVFFILEQSCPLRPKSQKHVPLVVSQIPASLQLFGQVHSKKYYLHVLCITYFLALFTAPGILARFVLAQTFLHRGHFGLLTCQNVCWAKSPVAKRSKPQGAKNEYNLLKYQVQKKGQTQITLIF